MISLMNKVFALFSRGEIIKAYNLLKKIMFKTDVMQLSTEDKRLLLYNLSWAQDELGMTDAAQENIYKLIDIINSDKEYLNDKNNSININNVYVLQEYLLEKKSMKDKDIKGKEYYLTNIEKYNNAGDIVNALIYKIKYDFIYSTDEEIEDTMDMIWNYSICKNTTMQQQLLLILKKSIDYIKNNKQDLYNYFIKRYNIKIDEDNNIIIK